MARKATTKEPRRIWPAGWDDVVVIEPTPNEPETTEEAADE
jgi:hypothetical protein